MSWKPGLDALAYPRWTGPGRWLCSPAGSSAKPPTINTMTAQHCVTIAIETDNSYHIGLHE